MQSGIYEQIVNLVLERRIRNYPERHLLESIEVADSHDYLAQYIYRILSQGLAQISPEPGLTSDRERRESRLQRQIAVCNEIITSLEQAGVEGVHDLRVSQASKRLLAILEEAALVVEPPARPDTPLALGALLTGTRQDPSLVSQLKKEIASAERVDILCSFIKWSGIRILEPALRFFTAKEGVCLRIVTTSYMGATDLKAIEFLTELPNTEIKVSYDTHRTRLHAKAYLIHRETGFSSAYIGSANISQAALTDGLEWTVKLSQYEQPFQWEKVSATFESYWNDDEFQTYNTEGDRERLRSALIAERGACDNAQFVLPSFDLKPYAFQQEILDKINAERQLQQRKKHLVVAATGTGKTMIAAFDFKLWRQQMRDCGDLQPPKFLFVAHREEILRQSLYSFRAVLKDQNFGDLMVAGNRPSQIEQLFVSIQTYNSQKLSELVSSEHYDYVVVDEFHRAAAPSYEDLLSHVNPLSLLGLTATPERLDGRDIRSYFDNHITAEIRLPDAINRKLLCPFQYFGISDSVDYSSLRWSRGGYVQSDLESILTGNDVRANLVIEKLAETVLDISKVRGLCFCVSQAHAEYMARKFNQSNIPADFLTANSSREHRLSVQQRLCEREINFIFVVDLYNEGVDIPEVDTVIFLRPTESLTVFLQQLGRGLRLADDKDCLTVLDFVGQAHKKYRFDIRYRALLTDGNKKVKDELENDFPHLPAGCNIQFEKQAYQYVLENVKSEIVQSKPRIIQNIASFDSDTGKELNLPNFLEYHGMQLDDIYRRASWARLCVDAGVKEDFYNPNEARLTKGLRRLQHIDDVNQIDFLLSILQSQRSELSSLTRLEQKRLAMLMFTLWSKADIAPTLAENWDNLSENSVLRKELIDLLSYRREHISSSVSAQSFGFECPLDVHARYTRDEIFAGLGYWTLEHQSAMREGVLYLPEIKTDVFFITLNKSEQHYSPTTMYEDYAISSDLFHWQSQSTTSSESPTGQRYINHRSTGNKILLFVRESRQNCNRFAEPYYFLGQADYVSHTGSRPMNVVWKLKTPMPARLMRWTRSLVN
ncbi:type I restriction enzyme EcoKI subunit R [Anaerohalosphaera lusitana]|uniref:Type I restriction enzyme EcoKI subunit R n=1 Tax=Anaerohalosphaera lusitana TaxID=1936003 RepID=A0A1U9NQH7_9BACT|nr:DEAD/DEAH box helicase [Anaerohalosphaera lusitana]AQT70075.1 type I restriction enzyme EcoKI subunit R [Anaerohalosphaera lusitana]